MGVLIFDKFTAGQVEYEAWLQQRKANEEGNHGCKI